MDGATAAVRRATTIEPAWWALRNSGRGDKGERWSILDGIVDVDFWKEE